MNNLNKISWLMCGLALLLVGGLQGQSTNDKVLLAGAAQSVITPPVGYSINGGMRDGTVANVHDETHAKSIVLDNGENQLAFVISDLCMVYKETLDKAKARAHELTGIPVENMMMSATHTHSSGTACSVFQSDPAPEYLDFLSVRIADALARAYANRVPAKIGWGFGSEPSQVFNRRWYLQPGKTSTNPFGTEDKVRMNPGATNPDKTIPAGPVDPEVSVVSIVSLEGEQIALMSNYSLHYVGGVGSGDVSADYFGLFGKRMGKLLGAEDQERPFVGIMTNGTSGNINNVDYSGKAYKKSGAYNQMNYVANVVAAEAYKVVQAIEYKDWISLESAQDEISLGVRKPTAAELVRAKKLLAAAEGPVLKARTDIYARETVMINEYPDQVPLILQAFRLGDLAIAAIPCEVFVEIGLQLKAENPFEDMFTISLANGYNGYLPTPEQHALGGYETWRAKSSYLEVNASLTIVDKIMGLLNQLNK